MMSDWLTLAERGLERFVLAPVSFVVLIIAAQRVYSGDLALAVACVAFAFAIGVIGQSLTKNRAKSPTELAKGWSDEPAIGSPSPELSLEGSSIFARELMRFATLNAAFALVIGLLGTRHWWEVAVAVIVVWVGAMIYAGLVSTAYVQIAKWWVR